MVIDNDTLTAISDAVAEKVNKNNNVSMQHQFNQFKESIETFNKSQSDNLGNALRSRMDEVLTSLLTKQDDHEAKSEQRLADLETSLSGRQEDHEKRNADKFSEIAKQLSSINQAIAEKTSSTPSSAPLLPIQPVVTASQVMPVYGQQHPPHPASLPLPTFASPQLPTQKHPNLSDLATIEIIVSNASTILGLGPISADDIDDADGETADQKLFSAALDFLRNEIAVKESEVKDDDIIKVFPASDPDLQRVYVQFSTKEQAELCQELTRKLRKPDLNAVLYVPKGFKDRFHAMKREDYRLRRQTEPKHKTRIAYTESDLALYICPVGHYRYMYHPIPDLPHVDLAPVRTPPQGRKTKRARVESSSPG